MQFRSSARSVPHFQGTLQEGINHPAKWCWKLPESVSLEEGALVEPLSVAIHAVRRSGISIESGSGRQGMHVKASLVLGAGTIGLMTAAVLRVSGVRTVVVADVNEARVSFAVENGSADRGVVVERSSEEAQTTEDKMIWARQGAKRLGKVCRYGSLDAIGEFDVVLECTGVESCVQTAIYVSLIYAYLVLWLIRTKATRPGGKVLLVGIGAAVQTLPIAAAAQREVDLIGVFRYASTYADGIEMIAATNEGRQVEGVSAGTRPLPDLTVLVTHRFRGLTSVKEAFEMASRSIDDAGELVLKVMVQG